MLRCGSGPRYSNASPRICKDIPMILRDKFYIGGQWVAPSSKEMIEVHGTGDGAVMGKVPAGAARDIEAAVAAAHGALESWSATPVEKRAEYLQKISDGPKG